VANDDKLQEMSLEYEHSTDKLSIRDSACATDKTVYRTIVVAFITLLIFFIASQVVTDDASKQNSVTGQKVVQATQAVAAVSTAIGLRNSFQNTYTKYTGVL
jgi:ABC-type dipeptide/oligopeptide/nickel transport system permease component